MNTILTNIIIPVTSISSFGEMLINMVISACWCYLKHHVLLSYITKVVWVVWCSDKSSSSAKNRQFWNGLQFIRQAGPRKPLFPPFSWMTTWEMTPHEGKQPCLHQKKLLSLLKSQRNQQFCLPSEPSVGWPWCRELNQPPNQLWCTSQAEPLSTDLMVGGTSFSLGVIVMYITGRDYFQRLDGRWNIFLFCVLGQ